jgi:hypothetical protein
MSYLSYHVNLADMEHNMRAFNLHVSRSSLRRVPEMPHSLFARFHSVSQWIVSDPAQYERRLGVDSVLFLRHTAGMQSVAFDGPEGIRTPRPSLPSRLRIVGRSVGSAKGNADMIRQYSRRQRTRCPMTFTH